MSREITTLYLPQFYTLSCVPSVAAESQDTELELSGPAAVLSHIYLQSHLCHYACIQ